MNKNSAVTGNQGEDCFLCNIFPFLRALFPVKDTFQDPRVPTSAYVPSSAASSSDALSTTNMDTNQSTGTATEEDTPLPMDFKNADYRGFIFAIHPQYGYLLLHCTRKKKKPPHFQLPGGHVDAFEFDEALAETDNDRHAQLMLAGKKGAARELFEETGLDVRQQLSRLQPTPLYDTKKKKKLPNEYKSRLFYTLQLKDDDFLTSDNLSISDAAFLQRAMGAQPPDLKLKLSPEHQGFAFEKSPDVAATLLQHHSGGKVSSALRMKMASTINDQQR